jgi:hypothetical protein
MNRARFFLLLLLFIFCYFSCSFCCWFLYVIFPVLLVIVLFLLFSFSCCYGFRSSFYCWFYWVLNSTYNNRYVRTYICTVFLLHYVICVRMQLFTFVQTTRKQKRNPHLMTSRRTIPFFLLRRSEPPQTWRSTVHIWNQNRQVILDFFGENVF